MDWDQWEDKDSWRDVKCRFKGQWSSLETGLEEVAGERRPRAQLAARRRAEESIEWQELEAEVLASDLDELILDFASAGNHH